MIENLLNLIRQQADEVIIKNPAIPNERNDEAISLTGQSVENSLQSMLSQGNIKDVLSMFSGKQEISPANPNVSNMVGQLTENFKNQFNLNNQEAGGMASSLIPQVLKSLVSKTNDPGDNSFDIQGIFNQLTGGKTSNMNISGMLGKFSGSLDKDGDGDVDLQDLSALLSGGNNQPGGGVMDKLKGLFK